jgi:hypothetical protein
VADTFRQQFRTGRKSVLDAYKAAHPTLLLHTYDYPPESYHTPMAYVEKGVDEVVRHDAQTKSRVITGNVVIVNKLMSNAQATAEQDVIVDGLHDQFTATPRAASSSTLLEVTRVTDTELTDANGNRYAAAVMVITGTQLLGRP